MGGFTFGVGSLSRFHIEMSDYSLNKVRADLRVEFGALYNLESGSVLKMTFPPEYKKLDTISPPIECAIIPSTLYCNVISDYLYISGFDGTTSNVTVELSGITNPSVRPTGNFSAVVTYFDNGTTIISSTYNGTIPWGSIASAGTMITNIKPEYRTAGVPTKLTFSISP